MTECVEYPDDQRRLRELLKLDEDGDVALSKGVSDE